MKIKQLILLILIFLFGLLLSIAPEQAWAQAVANSPVYSETTLASGWQDWSYNGININYANTGPVHAGNTSIAVTYTGGWSGLQFGYHGASLDVSAYDTFRFWIHGGTTGSQIIVLQIEGIEQSLTVQANTWTQVDVSLLSLGSPRTVSSISWFNNTAGSQPVFYLDDIAFINSGNPPPPTLPPGSGPALSVDAAADRHPISRYIYGINYASESVAADLRLPVRRWGGNSTTRYNWQLDIHNTGSDWYYENIPEENAHPELLPNGSAADRFVEQDRRTNTETLLTVPLIGWTPKARKESHPYDCGFKVSLYGAQDSVDEWDTDCGNGELGGNPLTGNDPHDTSVEITPAFVSSWVNHLVTKYGAAANGGVMFYNLDNEPMLWNSTHRDVHPDPVTYDEIRDRTWAYAAAIKAADPTAKTLGPVVWGWCAYFYSAADGCTPGADRQAHGNLDFIEWYLQQMHAYEQQHDVRILDYLDVHIYPQVNGVYSENLGSASVQAARLRSTRQLWDASYVHEGWIGQPVYLIPRMKQWTDNNYPGTQLAITEYNWGALDFMNGALAQADLLGIFGREGLGLATLWGPPDNTNAPGIFAFRMFRNYNGQGAAFGETSLRAISADQEKLAIYAAQRSSGELTLIVINKTALPLTSPLTLTNFQPASTAQVYRYSANNLTAIVREADMAVATSGFSATFPANSITLMIIPVKGTPGVAIFADVPLTYWAWDYIERLYNAGITGGCGANPLIYCPENTVTRAQMAIFLERGMNGSGFSPPSASGAVFDDVAASHWAAAWIEQLADDGITGGCGAGNYCPESPVTRAQMAVFLLKAMHGSSYLPPAVGASSGFSDVPANHWAAAWIKQLAAEDITSGCGAGNYCPDQSVTRAQMAVFLVRAFNLP
ncbi:MAG: hypothetical protein CVU44_12175 [Chloroflexi bacterium HGW-Chloroflexi-6]|nr:MAG: hypothetical protein CVU44_12175 [Chloroflexi bacterium HGW-Chloroflexi-6]